MNKIKKMSEYAETYSLISFNEKELKEMLSPK